MEKHHAESVAGLGCGIFELGFEPRRLLAARIEGFFGVQREEPHAAGMRAEIAVLAVEACLVEEACVVEQKFVGLFRFVIADRGQK